MKSQSRKFITTRILVLTVLGLVSFFSPFMSAQAESPDNLHLVDASSNNFPPMNFLDKEGNLSGFGRELSDAVIKEVGGEVEHLHSSHWVEVLDWLDTGKADFIHDTGYTENRDKFLDYSDPIIEMPEVIFVGADEYSISDFDTLKGKTVVCVNKHITHLYLQQFPEISLLVVDTPTQALYELISGKVDAFIYPKQIVLFLVQGLRLRDKIKITGEPLRTLTWSMVVKEGNNEILQLLNKGIARVRKSGEYDRIYNKWWGEKILAGYSKRELLVITTLVTGAALAVLIAIGFFFFNRSLRKKQNMLKSEIIEHARAEDKLIEALEIINRSPAVAFRWKNAKGWPVEYVSENVQGLFGYSSKDFTEARISYDKIIHPADVSRVADEVAKHSNDKDIVDFSHMPYRIITQEGEVKWIEDHTHIVRNNEGQVTHYQGIVGDISSRVQAEQEKQKLEAQLRQSQKMEAVGIMAGGIAHDFNNILSAIVGYAEFIKDEVPEDNQAREDVGQILTAADRAINLVKQILAFSRQAEQELIPLRPHIIVKETMKLLRSTIPTTVEIWQDVDSQCGTIYADPTQIHQVLMNLCSNAVQAVNEKGTIEVTLTQVELTDADLTKHRDMPPGPYMRLSVKDNGSGMDAETQQKIFDPFFTTKELGKGTGMGLSVVHGIIESHKGMIIVDSEPGKGSTFNVFIPAINGGEEDLVISQKTEDQTLGTGRILFVDDEEILARMGTRMLKLLGYRVTQHTNSRNALEAFKSNPDAFDLVITDQSMPGLSGSELTAEILKIRPTMPIIICTGYSSKVSEDDFKELGASEFMMKPYDKNSLAKIVRKALDKKI